MISHFKMFEHPRGVKVEVLHTSMVFPDITIEQMGDAWRKHADRDMPLHQAFSFLSEEQYDFLMSGMLPGEWNALMKEAESPAYYDV